MDGGQGVKMDSPGVWGLSGEGAVVRQVSISDMDYIIVLIQL